MKRTRISLSLSGDARLFADQGVICGFGGLGQTALPLRLRLSMMLVIPAVVRCRSVGKNQVVGNIVMRDAADIECGWFESCENRWRVRTQIAKDSDHSDA